MVFWVSGQPTTTLAPGELTVHWEEFINHYGAPFRIAISVGSDSNYDNLILIDHLPHMDVTGTPQYIFNITIPNINCPQCSLQLMNPMSSSCCSYPNTLGSNTVCYGVYHSCANINITGTIPPGQYNHTNPQEKAYRSENAQWTLDTDGNYWLSPSAQITLNPTTCPSDPVSTETSSTSAATTSSTKSVGRTSEMPTASIGSLNSACVLLLSFLHLLHIF